jgi:hypothetical protein
MGERFGKTLVTLHRFAGERRCVLVLGHFEAFSPEVTRGARLAAGTQLGTVGLVPETGESALHLEVRELRLDVDVRALDLASVLEAAKTIPVDPRNVMPLRK